MINKVSLVIAKVIFIGITLLTIVVANNSCSTRCTHCKVKLRVINLPDGCNIRESFCKIGIGSPEELDAINNGIPTRLTSKVVLQRYPANPENMGEFDVDCNKGIVVSNMQIRLDDCCPTGSGDAFYYFAGTEVYSYIFKNECEPTLTYDLLRDFIFAGCM